MISKSMTVELPNGLDARPVAELVQVASRYESSIHIEAGSTKVNAKSIMGMMALDLDNGQSLTVIAEGSDESEAVNEIESFLKGEKKVAPCCHHNRRSVRFIQRDEDASGLPQSSGLPQFFCAQIRVLEESGPVIRKISCGPGFQGGTGEFPGRPPR